ncbi:SIMPL domain-containing protein [Terricaulis silvestris]|uniref:26 kDa periplasmic immunogenic protein n=1 Tax=Terricaulis silvestris TaxID=2686094 RepID=A0A6I6MUZ8_9CAUL|nr:SIMPL domain-containing protein [Terricaulis silvestris]QGZ96264.1 26 kDa periplasmic immunogenic protein precursor [Terricaulis silvestris]
MSLSRAAAAFAVMAAAAAPMASAQTPQVVAPSTQGTLLSVSAEGLSEGRPDMAIINLGVTTEGQTAAAALAENARRMTALTAALRRAGIAERDIQTSNVSVYPQQQYVEGQQPRITGYQANNTVTAKVRAIDNTGRVIDAAVGAGGNTVNGVSFTYQDPDAQLDVARRDAIAEARRRAELYANALNMRVVRIVAVQEGGGFSPPMPMMMARMEGADAQSTPISPGQIETRVSVSVTFELR